MARRRTPIFDEIIESCEYHGINDIMGFKYDWNEEIVSQFYSTIFFDVKRRKLVWMTDRERYSCTLPRFTSILGLKESLNEPKHIHEGNSMNPSLMNYV